MVIFMKKIIVFVLSFSLLFCTPMSVCAGQMPVDDENIKAKSVVLLDMDSREVLYAKNENEELNNPKYTTPNVPSPNCLSNINSS